MSSLQSEKQRDYVSSVWTAHNKKVQPKHVRKILEHFWAQLMSGWSSKHLLLAPWSRDLQAWWSSICNVICNSWTAEILGQNSLNCEAWRRNSKLKCTVQVYEIASARSLCFIFRNNKALHFFWRNNEAFEIVNSIILIILITLLTLFQLKKMKCFILILKKQIKCIIISSNKNQTPQNLWRN